MHTKGPWAVESVMSDSNHDICLDYDVPGAGCPILVATCFSDEKVESANRCPGDISSHEAQANALLIAAAPDLLAACEAAAQLLIGDLVEPGRTVFWQCIAAAKKAKGQS